MKLFVIRHGEKESDEFSSNLTPSGKDQAKKISKILKNNGICKIYCSTNPRSVQTGQIISKEIGVQFQVIDSIKELPREIFFQPETEWNYKNKMLIMNIRLFLDGITKNNENAALAMHAGINRAILSIILDIPIQKTIHFTQDIACINLFEFKEIYGEKRWCVRLLNSTHHLQ